jgi:hypothetical protein
MSTTIKTAVEDLQNFLLEHKDYNKLAITPSIIEVNKGQKDYVVTILFLLFFIIAPLTWFFYEALANNNYPYLLFLFIPFIFFRLLLKIVRSEKNLIINLNTKELCTINANGLLSKFFKPNNISVKDISHITLEENIVQHKMSATKWNELKAVLFNNKKIILASFAQTEFENQLALKLQNIIKSLIKNN